MRRFGSLSVSFAVLIAAGVFAASPAFADLLITVDKTTQRMTVEKDGEPLFVWPVSTGAASYDTPSGSYKPFRLEKDHFSREWDEAPMPHSIFFTTRGHAIHGSTHKSIGRPASHGCVRLEPKNAALLFSLVKQEGLARSRVVITGEAQFAPQVAKTDQTRTDAPRRNTVARAAPGFDQAFADDEITASVPPAYVQPRYAPPADIPPAYAPRRGERRVIGYRDARTGQIYYYDRPRAYYAPPPPPRYYQRYSDDAPRGLYYYGR